MEVSNRMSSHNKQREQAKKRRLKRLRKKSRGSSSLPPGAVIVRNLPGAAKMSEVLEEFVKPYWEMATTEDAMRKLLTVACVAWNAALLPPAERKKMIRESEETLPAEARPDFRALLEPLIARKQAQFAENQRAILSFELTMRPTGPYLEVMSTLGLLR